jgi:hypothetical protein
VFNIEQKLMEGISTAFSMLVVLDFRLNLVNVDGTAEAQRRDWPKRLLGANKVSKILSLN